MQTYRFYGWQEAGVPAVDRSWPGIDTPLDLYGKLSQIWCAETCAPRLRARWTPENRTLGQCSITAFLVQDLFGGQLEACRIVFGAEPKDYEVYDFLLKNWHRLRFSPPDTRS